MNSFMWTKPLIQENHSLVTAVIIVAFLHQQADCDCIMLEPKTFPSLLCLHSNIQALGRKGLAQVQNGFTLFCNYCVWYINSLGVTIHFW